jgi:thioredoxin-like negative regulator of GroEL
LDAEGAVKKISMTKLTRTDLNTFLRQTPVAIVHLDAEWDGYRFAVAEQIAQIESQFVGVASFGYMDVDEEQEYAREIDLRNTPACAYFKHGKLIAVVIGIGQDIAKNIEDIQKGGVPDTPNWMSRL